MPAAELVVCFHMYAPHTLLPVHSVLLVFTYRHYVLLFAGGVFACGGPVCRGAGAAAPGGRGGRQVHAVSEAPLSIGMMHVQALTRDWRAWHKCSLPCCSSWPVLPPHLVSSPPLHTPVLSARLPPSCCAAAWCSLRRTARPPPLTSASWAPGRQTAAGCLTWW